MNCQRQEAGQSHPLWEGVRVPSQPGIQEPLPWVTGVLMQPGFLPSCLGAHPSRRLAWAIQPGIRCCLKFGLKKKIQNLKRTFHVIWKHRMSVSLLKSYFSNGRLLNAWDRGHQRGWGGVLAPPCTVCGSWGMCPVPGTLAKPRLCPDDRNPPGPVPLLTSPRPPVLNVSAEQGPAAFTPARPPPPSGSQPTAKVNETCQRPKAKVNCPCCNSSTLPGAKQTCLLKSCTRLTLSYENRLTVFLPHPWVLRRDRSSSASLWFYWTSLVQRRAAAWADLCQPRARVQVRAQPRTHGQQLPGSPGPRPSSCRHQCFSSPESNRQSPRGWPDVQTSCSNSK